VNAAAEVIYDLVDPNANLIFGAVVDEALHGQVSITLIATGFRAQEEFEARNLQAKLSAHLNSLFCSQSVFDASSLHLVHCPKVDNKY
jgi:cell division GTPase FtsZ